MNIDRIIKMQMIKLSNKYEMSMIEISKVKEDRVRKTINFNIKLKGSSPKDNLCMRFNNKRELVSWLVCQS
ncbi:MAG: hypothetical protein IJ501_06705 [Bacilli bacterium]|nr:hypothetical protein [Bacilli bacterium]